MRVFDQILKSSNPRILKKIPLQYTATVIKTYHTNVPTVPAANAAVIHCLPALILKVWA